MDMRLCGYAGCQEIATDGTRCEEHAEEMKAKEAARKARIDLERQGGAFRKLYNTARWRKLQRAFLKANQVCIECDSVGLVKASEVVDHIEGHGHRSLKLFWDKNNWQALCRRCHNRKTAREVGFAGRHTGGA